MNKIPIGAFYACRPNEAEFAKKYEDVSTEMPFTLRCPSHFFVGSSVVSSALFKSTEGRHVPPL